MDARYHAALPNLLVGAGLLFTFVGLAAALGTAGGIVSAGEQATRNVALQTLLETASFKFITSLAGLGLSILYALYRKRRFHLVERALDTFLATLEARVPLLTPAAVQQEANELLRRQSTQLETFSTDLAVNLGAAFDRAFDERLGEHIAPLTESMQRLAERMGTGNDAAMQAMLDGFIKRLQGGAGDRMDEVTKNLGGLGAQLEGLKESLGNAATQMANSADAMATRMGQGAEVVLARITEQMSGLMSELRSLAENSRAAGSETFSALSDRFEAASEGFESSAARVAGSLEQAARQTSSALETGSADVVRRISEAAEVLTRQIAGLTSAADSLAVKIGDLDHVARDAARPLSAAASDLKAAGLAARGALEALDQAAHVATSAVKEIASTAQQLNGAQVAAESLAESLNAAAQRFEGIDKELANTLKELQTGLQGFTREVGTFVGQTDQNLAKAATHWPAPGSVDTRLS